jgi:PAS domain S-box-containing protein
LEVFIILETENSNYREDNDLLHEDMKKSYKELVEAHNFAQIGSWEMDMLRNTGYLSEEAYRIYGISSEHYDGTYDGFIRLIHPEDRNAVENNINGTAKSVYEMEYRIIRPDGSVRGIRHLVKPIFDREGNLMYLYGTIQDSTGMKEVQDFLGETEETIDRIQKRFQMLVQQSSDVFEIISPDFTIQYISPAVEKIIGYKPEQRIGKSALEFIEEGERYKFERMVDAVLERPEERMQGDITLRDDNGKISYLTYTM